jgi:hypothetical protein
MQTITTSYRSPTETRGARWSARSSSGVSVTIKDNHNWTKRDENGTDTGHFAALHALLAKMGRDWPGSDMIGGTLNRKGDMVWIFVSDRSSRSNSPPEPLT